MKFNLSLFVALFLILTASAQNKYEREFRIAKSDFPQTAWEQINSYLEDAKRVRFYRETDSVKQSFEAKFKKGKLHYSIEFNNKGELEDVEFIINKNDIPELTWSQIKAYLNSKFNKPRIKKIQQQYPAGTSEASQVLREAFQNLLLPYIKYEIVFTGKTEKGFQTYEGLFNADGKLVNLRKSISARYDHILY
ncbi:hypothetical protein [Flagellimonas nanhaiensis]|uniref:PepSY domain-containing protein n=1 Tax=Flagellimonas nanhaiensis TaxID=2292706 RepID=A0A371JPU0_9FLAO|nr:hypothetical protein [Allomuricauda nanhaiensis]RDY59530.1 hypothetical protein DX873_09125 [Allomuricauda nanhaiensis]